MAQQAKGAQDGCRYREGGPPAAQQNGQNQCRGKGQAGRKPPNGLAPWGGRMVPGLHENIGRREFIQFQGKTHGTERLPDGVLAGRLEKPVSA